MNAIAEYIQGPPAAPSHWPLATPLTAGSIKIEHVRKVFPYRNPNPGLSDDDMWVSYLRLLWRTWRNRTGDRAAQDDIVALDEVNLEIRPGELFSILGPNGAGKTTLVKILATTLRPTSGRLVVNGYDLRREPARVRGSLTVVMSANWLAMDYELTLLRNLVFWGQLYGLDRHTTRQKALRALKVVGLAEWTEQRPGKLSSGMRQRLAVAKGLLFRSPIFILDEPTVNVDPTGAYQIRDFLRNELNRGLGQTVVLTTHNMAEAQQLSDRVAIIDRGRVLACASPAMLIRDLGNCVVEVAITGCVPEAVRALREHGLALQVVDFLNPQGDGRIRVHLRPGADQAAVRTTLEAYCREITEVSTGTPTLEDVFVRLTGRKLDERGNGRA
jgi:ABC-2 type transport system ATP-binding protein